MYLWNKSVPAERADIWVERLSGVISPDRIAVISPADARNVRLEIYCHTEAEADGLANECGGRVRVLRAESWQPLPATAPGRPLNIGGRLWVTGRAEELPTLRVAHPNKAVLCIPAAMAFGTGEHATTAMCLRLLAETARTLAAAPRWKLLDLGSGSGILALAGKIFGARTALGLDNDPHAVRTARQNATLNGVRGVRFQRADLLSAWQLERGAWPVITANLFSELLTALLPQIRAALTDGGSLIASGVLASQAAELENSLRENGLRLLTRRRRGKWTAFLVCRDAADATQISGTTASPTRKRPPGSA